MTILDIVNEGPVVEAGTAFYVIMTIILVLLISPWFFLIFRYGIFRRLRVRYILSPQEELPAVYLKKKADIPLPTAPEKKGYTFVGWFIDEDRTEPYIPMPMPDKNIKLYGKYQKNEDQTQ